MNKKNKKKDTTAGWCRAGSEEQTTSSVLFLNSIQNLLFTDSHCSLCAHCTVKAPITEHVGQGVNIKLHNNEGKAKTQCANKLTKPPEHKKQFSILGNNLKSKLENIDPKLEEPQSSETLMDTWTGSSIQKQILLGVFSQYTGSCSGKDCGGLLSAMKPV